ncbi:hypothetical protein PFISCL1PPCAC_15545, partial [Pristionchus fissidentatus]
GRGLNDNKIGMGGRGSRVEMAKFEADYGTGGEGTPGYGSRHGDKIGMGGGESRVEMMSRKAVPDWNLSGTNLRKSPSPGRTIRRSPRRDRSVKKPRLEIEDSQESIYYPDEIVSAPSLFETFKGDLDKHSELIGSTTVDASLIVALPHHETTGRRLKGQESAIPHQHFHQITRSINSGCVHM